MYYVYILRCKDNSPYTGFSEDLKERINRHKKGHVPATRSRLPIELAFYCAFVDKYSAWNLRNI
jgi:putative endonuclease